MGSPNQLSLEILIKTIAENRGIAVTNEQVKELASNLRTAAGAGDDVTTSADEIARALQGTGKAAEESAKGTDIFARALENIEKQGSGVTEQMKEQAKAFERNVEVSEKVSKSSQNLRKDISQAKEGFSGLQDIVGGILTANLLRVGEGMLKVGKASADAGPRLQAFFSQIARGGAAGAAIGAPLLIASKAMEMYAADVEKFNKRILDSTRDTSEQRKKIIADETAAVVADYAKQAKAATDAAVAAEESQKRTAVAYDRAAKKESATRDLRDTNLDIEEKNALSKAKTDDQREKIKRDFARRRDTNQAQDKLSDFNTSDYQGQVQASEAQRAIDDAIARNRDAQQGVGEAELDFQNKQSVAQSFKPTDSSAAAVQARKAALDARDRVATLKGEAGKVESETSKTIQVNQAIIDQAKDTKEIVAIQREILKATLQQKAKESATQSPTSEGSKDAAAIKKALDADAAAPQAVKPGSGGTIEVAGRTIKVDSAQTVEKLQVAGAALGKTLDAVDQFASGVTKKSEKLAINLQNERERSGGG